MTDNEIIKALKTLLELVLYEGCQQRAKTISLAIDIINHQKAEIERLEKENTAWMNDNNVKAANIEYLSKIVTATDKLIITAKAEAIKEFCEKRGIEYVETDI